jgi:hypothetical protein
LYRNVSRRITLIHFDVINQYYEIFILQMNGTLECVKTDQPIQSGWYKPS